MANFYHFGNEKLTSKKDLQRFFSPHPHEIVVDVETISLDDRTIIGIGIAISPNEAFYFPTYPSVSGYIPWEVLCDPTVKKIYHNGLNFDLHALYDNGYYIDEENSADTTILARLIPNCPMRLADIAEQMLDGFHTSNLKDEMTKYGCKGTLRIPEEVIAEHCCKDTQATFAFYREYYDKLKDKAYFEFENTLIPIMLEMGRRGLKIDTELRAEIEKELQLSVDLYKSMAEGIGFKLSSPQQVGYMLYKDGIILPRNWKTGSAKTEESVLKRVNHPIAGMVLAYRDVSYQLSHYIAPLAGFDRCYTNFTLDAITGRWTSRGDKIKKRLIKKRQATNMQNWPKGRIRNICLPDSGTFTDWDYNQIELRVLAHMADDPEMKYILSLPALNPDGSKNIDADIHQQTADFMGMSRKIGKEMNFAMPYGATVETIIERTGLSRDMSARLLSMWFRKFPRAGDWIYETQEQSLKSGYTTTLYGRDIQLPIGEEDDDSIRRKGVNYPIQGGAAEIVKRALPLIRKTDVRLQVHDEFLMDGIYEIPESFAHIHPEIYTPFESKLISRWE
jgi:DNA polymerase-1